MKQSPSQQCKQAGLNSLAEVSRMTNVSAQTLTNWCKSKPQLFKAVIDGCMWQKRQTHWLRFTNPKYDNITLSEKRFKELYMCAFNPSDQTLNELQKITEKEYYEGSN